MFLLLMFLLFESMTFLLSQTIPELYGLVIQSLLLMIINVAILAIPTEVKGPTLLRQVEGAPHFVV